MEHNSKLYDCDIYISDSKAVLTEGWNCMVIIIEGAKGMLHYLILLEMYPCHQEK